MKPKTLQQAIFNALSWNLPLSMIKERMLREVTTYLKARFAIEVQKARRSGDAELARKLESVLAEVLES